MRKFPLLMVMAVTAVALSACTDGGSSSSREIVDRQQMKDAVEATNVAPIDFAVIGAIDCRGVNPEGGMVGLKAKIHYDEGIMRDSFTYTYSIEGSEVDFETPIVSITADGGSYLLDGDMYIYPNDTDDAVTHVFDLTYLDKGIQRLYRGACKQGKYINIVEGGETQEAEPSHHIEEGE